MRAAVLAVAAAAVLSAVPAQAGVTPGCDNPVDVVCNEGYCPGEACTPIICAVWVQNRCVL
jgi:hypothetical protein